MTKAQHTQGGWSRNIKPASKYNTIYAGRNTHICHLATTGLSNDEIEANCNLIAAAPKMLEALERLMQLEKLMYDKEETLTHEWADDFKFARNTINEAKYDNQA